MKKYYKAPVSILIELDAEDLIAESPIRDDGGLDGVEGGTGDTSRDGIFEGDIKVVRHNTWDDEW